MILRFYSKCQAPLKKILIATWTFKLLTLLAPISQNGQTQ